MEDTPTPPLLAPGLVAESVQAGNLLFRWRSYPPVVILAYVLFMVWREPLPMGGTDWIGAWVALAFASGFLGLAIRAWALGHVPLGTSGRGTKELRAETLNTRGLYSLVRHPLYLGNYFLWLSVPLLAGKPTVVLAVTLAFWVYYERIMMAEERFLHKRFGDTFGAWASGTPAFVPRLTGWRPSEYPYSFRFVLGRDYQALFGLVAATTTVVLVRGLSLGDGWLLPNAWLAWFASGALAYGVLHALKRRTRLLEPPGDR